MGGGHFSKILDLPRGGLLSEIALRDTPCRKGLITHSFFLGIYLFLGRPKKGLTWFLKVILKELTEEFPLAWKYKGNNIMGFMDPAFRAHHKGKPLW